MTQLSNATLTTLQTTYFDDYNESKRFHRILFRPSTAVQARELTQLQTILQNQIQRFGDHMVDDGSVVDGVGITYNTKVPYIILQDLFDSNTELSTTEIDNTYLITNSTNSNNAVRAVVKVAKSGFLSSHNTTDGTISSNRFYLDYIKTGRDGSNNDVSEFAAGDTLYIYDFNQSRQGNLDANNLFDSIKTFAGNGTVNATGYGYGLTVSDGIIYQKGFFSKVEPQFVLVREYTSNPDGYVVGFNTEEEIVTENQDSSLNDNANGSTNYNAPGAHRLKLTPTLVSKSRTDANSYPNFFAIAEFDNLTPAIQRTDPFYNKLGDEFARRTREESGDYIVKPFQIDTYASANTDTFYYEISPGIAIVNGYRVELIGARRAETVRAITTDVAQNQVVTANYGNYVVCDEVVGAPTYDKLTEVTLYDAAQNSISDTEGVTGGPAGSIVGYANIKQIVYSSGTKGTAEAQYFVYLQNIRMSSGKNFASDVKSIYQNSSYGAFKADPVLESGSAVLKEANKASLLFNTGLRAIRRLTNNTGTNDTSYVYKQTTSATLLSNGYVVFSTATPAAGGTERLNYSVGTLSDGNDNDFNIILGSNTYTANLSGNVTVTSGNTTIVGSGTSFTTELRAGGFIRVGAAGAALYRINTISNNTIMTIYQTPGASYSGNVYQEFFLGGTILDLSGSGKTINIISNTQFSVSTGYTLDTTQTVYGQYSVQRTLAVHASKAINKNRLVKIDCSNNASTNTGPWDLGFVDVQKINAIYVGTTYANTNPDRSAWFNLDNGQRADMYDHAKLYIKPAYANQISTSTKILVDLNHFTANTSAGIGFFSVDSYPVSNTANSTTISYAEIPAFGSVELRNVIDFRPQKYSTANSVANTNPANTQITVNPVVSNTTFNVPAAGHYIAEADSNFMADFEFYLPRVDLLTLTKDGDLTVKTGIPSQAPLVPFNDTDTSPIAVAYVNAFPSLSVREGETYGRKDISTKIDIRTNRRYTMKDIGALEQRIKRLEYYTVLNALEQQARDMTIPDATGLNRFKNGIFADPFNSHGIGNVTDFEYKISIDKDKSVGRPYFTTHPVDFKFNANSSSGVQKTGSLVTLPYTHTLFANQRYATKFRNCTESVWQWNGKLNLYPSFDYHRAENQAPNQNVQLDFSAPWQDFANSPFGTTYGDWRDVSSSSTSSTTLGSVSGTGSSSSSSSTAALTGPGIITNTDTTVSADVTTTIGTATTTTTTTTTQEQIVSQLHVNTQTETYNLGTYVSDFSIQPYMRSRLVAFVAYNMKPNTTLHAFFDNTNVDAHCAPGVLSGITNPESGREDSIVTKQGNFGDPLVSNAAGFVCGIFRIPVDQFRVGDRAFTIVNVDNLETGADAIITKCVGTYSASNLSVTKQTQTLTTINPVLNTTSNTNTQTITSTDTTTSITGVSTAVVVSSNVTASAVEHNNSAGNDGLGGNGGCGNDPIAQSFYITSPSAASGLFLTKVGVHFYSKDPTLGISCYVVEMRLGFPDITTIVAESHLTSAQVSTSTNGQTETQFVLDQPVLLTKNKWYAFVIQPDGDSPEYQIWMGETGGIDVFTNEQVYSNPYSGLAFVSANRSTWTPIQKEDIKFNLYRANFTAGQGTAVFENEDDDFLIIDGVTRANSQVALEVGDLVYTVNSTSNNVLTTNASPRGVIQYVDEGAGIIYVDGSIGGFSNTTNPMVNIYRTSDPSNTSLVAANTLIATANVILVDDLTYHAVVPKFAAIEPTLTALTYSFKGTDTSYNLDASGKIVINGTEYEYLDKERISMSKSNEVTNNSGDKSSLFTITLGSLSSYVSPVIDLTKKASLFVENIVNNDATNEHTKYGNAITKYVSKNVVLASGQEAEDLKVFMTAYRPSGTDVKVYAKFADPTDPEGFDTKLWTELEYDNDSNVVYSNPFDRSNYIEYELSVPTSNAYATSAFRDAANSYRVTYYNNAGSIMGGDGGFKVFAIKIVLLAENGVNVPLLNDVRAIALQV